MKPIYLNKKKSHQCLDCKVWFRLKMTMNNHECTSKIQNPNKSRN